MHDKITVMLSTEGTYPFHQGGVSTWCDILVQRLKSVDYVIYSVLMDPFVTQKFKLPENTGLIKMPLWGTEEPGEHLDTPFSQNYLAKKRTSQQVVREHFIPLFSQLVEEIISVEKKPQRLAHLMLELHYCFQQYEYKLSFKSELTWETYKSIILRHVSDKRNGLARPDLYCLLQSLGWLYRFFNIINTPIPKTHVTHASAAAFCGIPCVLAKLKDKTPYLLTEHGIYLREQYLSLTKRGYPSFLNTFLVRLIHSITSINYAFADQVSPVCAYNTRWELQFDVKPQKIQVIYNGVDKNVFTESPPTHHENPTVVTVARIDPLKDILTLIRTAGVVKEKIPNVKFIVYGSVSVPDYYEQCLVLRKKMGLEETVIFAGHTANMSSAYQSGDIVALTSISEAFPYSVVEAMMSGKAVVSTDVGGIKEALGNTGLLVPPLDHEAMAEGIVRLLLNRELRSSLGQDARERALNQFTLDRVLELYLKSYIKLAVGAEERVAVRHRSAIARKAAASTRRRVLVERAYAFMSAEFFHEAIQHFRSAIMEDSDSPSNPVLIAEIAQAYNRLGYYDLAFLEMEKYEALVHLLENRQTA